MAFTASGFYVHTIREMMEGTSVTGGPINPTGTGTGWKLALHSDALTQGTAPLDYNAIDTTWANTNEVSGTGWAAGGVSLATAATGGSAADPVLTIVTGSLKYDMDDIEVPSTTLTGVRGCIIYFDAATAPADLADAMFIAITFGADYATSNGTFGITWNAAGVGVIDLTP